MTTQNKTQTQRRLGEAEVERALADLVTRDNKIVFKLDDVINYIVDVTGADKDDVRKILASMDGVTFVNVPQDHDNGGGEFIIVHADALDKPRYLVGTKDKLDEEFKNHIDDVRGAYVHAAAVNTVKTAEYMSLLCDAAQFDAEDVERGEANTNREFYKPMADMMKLSKVICHVADVLDLAADALLDAVDMFYEDEEKHYESYQLDKLCDTVIANYRKTLIEKIADAIEHPYVLYDD